MNSLDAPAKQARQCWFGFLFVTLAFTFRLGAQPVSPYVLSSGSFVVPIDVNSPLGVYGWEMVNYGFPGAVLNQLAQQWFWYRVGTDLQKSIDMISPAAVTQLDPATLLTRYVDSQNRFDLTIEYSLVGDSVTNFSAFSGPVVSDLEEKITIHNHSATSPLDFHLFQYSDFDLLGEAWGDSVTITRQPGTSVQQSKSGAATLDVATIPDVTHVQAGVNGDILNQLNGSSPVTLNDTLSAGTGNVNFALEWDYSIEAGGSQLIIADYHNDVILIPEPSTIGLVLIGLTLIIAQTLPKETRTSIGQL